MTHAIDMKAVWQACEDLDEAGITQPTVSQGVTAYLKAFARREAEHHRTSNLYRHERSAHND